MDGNLRAVLTVIGEALIDLVDSGDQHTFTAHLSGSPLNVAVGLARLGQPTELMARFSTDTFGRRLRDFAERNGVGLSAAVDAPQPTTLALINLDEQRKASYDFYLEGTANFQWTAAELAIPAATRIVHSGSLASWTPPGDARVIEALGASSALVSYDPNVRPTLLASPERARPIVEQTAAVAQLVKASEDDIAWLYPGDAAAAVATRWLALGPEAVVITRGEHGAVGYRAGADPIARAGRPIRLVDTIGAGDAFTSGLLTALATAGVHDAATLAVTDLGPALDEAILVAALTCERAGADPPTAAEVEAAR
ncbi:MAG TPA: carbohydrate kinase [Jatrophihabitantaceae bacterium]